MATRKKSISIALIVLTVAAWGAFAYFLIKTITSATKATSCFSADCAGIGAQEAANYVPWVIGTAFAGSILLTLLILYNRLSPSAGGPTSWDQVAQMATGATTPATGWPATGAPTVSPSNFALPGAGPTWSPTVGVGGPQAAVVATRTVSSSATGTEVQIDMDVTVPGQPTRRVTKQMVVPPASMTRLYTGATVPVTVNPSDPNDVTPLLG